MACAVVYWLLVDTISGGGRSGEWPRGYIGTHRCANRRCVAATNQPGPPARESAHSARCAHPTSRFHVTPSSAVPSRARPRAGTVRRIVKRQQCVVPVHHVAVPGRRHGLRRLLRVPEAGAHRAGGQHQPGFHALLVRTSGSVCPLQTDSSPRTRACYNNTYYLIITLNCFFVFIVLILVSRMPLISVMSVNGGSIAFLCIAIASFFCLLFVN